jgi:hypothetical protein
MQKKLAFAPIEKKLEWLKQHNEEHSSIYSSPDQELARRLYLAQHPTRIAAFKCMDGRINLPIVTNKPFGIIAPFRNLAGKFDLGWPYLGELFQEWVETSVDSGNRCLVLVTYHFSAGDNHHRGCAGFDYDRQKSFDFTLSFKRQIERVFGTRHEVVYPIVVGLETDADVLLFHGENGACLDLSKVTDRTDGSISEELSRLYPDMSRQMRLDLIPLVQGNLDHIQRIHAGARPIVEAQHCEWVLGVGRGFDWLHEPNLALLIGPYSPNLEEPLKMAFSIIKANMNEGRIASDGFVLLTSAPFTNRGTDRSRACEKALFLANYAQQVAAHDYAELLKIMRELTVVLDMSTRRFEQVNE